MPLPLANVNLDDRRWADLVEEGRALIPRYAPGWSDHNVSDPGITLIELFAWLTEQSVYRLNQVPERHRRKFLGLIGFPPRPPQPARATLAVGSWDLDPVVIPAGFEFEADDPEGRSIVFRTLRDLTVVSVALTAVQIDPGDDTLHDYSPRDWHEDLPLALLGDEPRPGGAFYLGFDQSMAEIPVTLAFHFGGPGAGPESRARLIEEMAQQRAALQHGLPDVQGDEQTQLAELGLPPHHSAWIVWEALTEGGIWMPLEPVAAGERPGPGQVWDDTRALTLDGRVEFNLPASIQRASYGSVDDELYWLRCRPETGAYDAAPLLRHLAINAVTAEQAVPVERSFVIPDTAEVHGDAPAAGEFARLRIALDSGDAIDSLTFLDRESEDACEHPDLQILDYHAPTEGNPGKLTLGVVPLGIGTDLPQQEVTLPNAPVQASSVTLYTHVGDRWQIWSRRADLDASRPTDQHFTLDATTGAIKFGDGERGQAPEASALILASYRSTRAEAGNLKAGSAFRPAATPRNVLASCLTADVRQRLGELTENPLDAHGGSAAETLARATGRAVDTLHAHERLVDVAAEHQQRTLDQIPGSRVTSIAPPSRGVNLLDLERLALDVPGTRIARARAWAALHPAYPCLHASGVVTIVVLTFLPLGRPEPSPGLLAAVRRYLNRRRMVATRLEVVGPRYLAVGVDADVRTKPHVDPARVRIQIVEAIEAFLDPLTGGPEGLGWPFGRDVFRSEILQLIDEVPGIDHVLRLRLTAEGGASTCGNLSLCPTWLTVSARHLIRVNPPADELPDTGPVRPVCVPDPFSEPIDNPT